MLALKSCPRCRGDMDLTTDPEPYCITCGHRPEWAAIDSVYGRPTNGSPPREVANALAVGGSLTTKQVGEWLGVGTWTVQNWIRTGRLPARPTSSHRGGRTFRITWSAIKTFQDERRRASFTLAEKFHGGRNGH